MTKSELSPQFSKFASKTTKGKFDEARKGERMGRGIPYQVGTTGTAVVAAIHCTETKADAEGRKHPFVRAELRIETPEAMRGKVLSGPGLMQIIKDGQNPEKWSAEDAWSSMLGMLEDLGLPDEISKGYKDFEECVDWFDQEPRKVRWEVVDASYQRNGKLVPQKGVAAYAFVDESKMQSADSDSDKPDEDPDADYVTYRGARHMILEEKGDTLKLKSMVNGRVREDVDVDDVERE